MLIDPFTIASAAILDALSTSSAVMAIVRPGNLIDVTDVAFERFKGQLQSADTPQVVLLPEAFELQPFGTNSRVATLTQSYQLIATHDSLRAGTVNALKYAAMAALLAAGPDLGLGSLVRSWEIRQGKDDPFAPPRWRGATQRWVSVMSLVVTMELDRATVIGGG